LFRYNVATSPICDEIAVNDDDVQKVLIGKNQNFGKKYNFGFFAIILIFGQNF